MQFIIFWRPVQKFMAGQWLQTTDVRFNIPKSLFKTIISKNNLLKYVLQMRKLIIESHYTYETTSNIITFLCQ